MDNLLKEIHKMVKTFAYIAGRVQQPDGRMSWKYQTQLISMCMHPRESPEKQLQANLLSNLN
jgi:hypothetical protein